MDDKALYGLQQELSELQVSLVRKRSEVSNLTVGYTRAEDGIGPIPAEPLKRNLMSARSELVRMERRLAEIEALLAEARARDGA